MFDSFSAFNYTTSQNNSYTMPLAGDKLAAHLYTHTQQLPAYRPRSSLVHAETHNPEQPRSQQPRTLVPVFASPLLTDSDTDLEPEYTYKFPAKEARPRQYCGYKRSCCSISSNSSNYSMKTANTNNTSATSLYTSSTKARYRKPTNFTASMKSIKENEENLKFFNLLGVHPDEFQDIADMLLERRLLGGTNNRFYVERRLALFLCMAAQGLSGQAAHLACRAYEIDSTALERTMRDVAEALAALDLVSSAASRQTQQRQRRQGLCDVAGALTGFHTTLGPDTDNHGEHRSQPEQACLKSYVLVAQDLETGLVTGVSAGSTGVNSARDVSKVFLRDATLQPPRGRFYIGTNALPMVDEKIMTPYCSGDEDEAVEVSFSEKELFNKQLAAARWQADSALEEFAARFPVLLNNNFPLEDQSNLVRALAVVNNTLVLKRRYQ